MAAPTMSASTIATVNQGSATPGSPFQSDAANFTAQDSASEIIIVAAFGFATSSGFTYDDMLIEGVGIATTGAVLRAQFVSPNAFRQCVAVWTIQPADSGWPDGVASDYIVQATGAKQQKVVVFSMEDVDATTPFPEVDDTGGAADGGTSASSSTDISVTSDMVLLGFSNSFDGAQSAYNPSDSGTLIQTLHAAGSDADVWRETGAGSTMTCEITLGSNSDIQMLYLVIQSTPVAVEIVMPQPQRIVRHSGRYL